MKNRFYISIFNIKIHIKVIFFATIVMIICLNGYFNNSNMQVYRVFVRDKNVVPIYERRNSGNGHQYRVYTDKGVFKISDTFFRWRWDAADRYNALVVGDSATITVVGHRLPFLSQFQNIIEVK